jgi:hypothetical protein
MKINEVTDQLDLDSARHFQLKSMRVPIIDSHLYTTLGRRLFDLYRKYDIAKGDQRDLESLCFLLTSFTVQEKESRWQNIRRQIGKRLPKINRDRKK